MIERCSVAAAPPSGSVWSHWGAELLLMPCAIWPRSCFIPFVSFCMNSIKVLAMKLGFYKFPNF